MDLRGTSATMRNIEGDIHAIKVYHTDAYKLAVQQGFEGTLNEWLASLKGAPGDPGKSAYQYAVDAGFKGTEEEFTQKLEADEVLEVEYGVTPIGEIVDAHNNGKAIVCKHGGLLLPLVQRDRNIATFSGFYNGNLHVIVNNDGEWRWTTDSYVKAVEVRNVDHDDTIPTVRAVYQKVAQSEEALTNVMPLIANRVSAPGYKFDKTYAEIREAVAAGRTVLLNNNNVMYALSASGPSYYQFMPFVTANTDVSKPGLRVNSSDVWSEVATGVEPMTEEKVKDLIDENVSDEIFVAEYGKTTAAEIAAAVNAGKLCVCQLPNDGGNNRGIAVLRDNNGINHFMFNAALSNSKHAYALLDRSGWSYVEQPYVAENGGGGGVSSWNDLTDKPFGEVIGDTLILPRIDLATLDPSTLIGGAYYKVNNQPVTMDELSNGFSVSVNGEETEIPPEQVPEVTYTIVDGVISIADWFISVEEKGVGVNSDFGTFPDSGIYVNIGLVIANAVTLTIPGFGKFESIKTLDEKYIPTGYKNVQPDWKQTDETAVDFIKNKPTVKQLYTRYAGNDLLYLTESRNGSGTDLTYAEFEEIIRKYDISQIRINGNMALSALNSGTHGVMLYRGFFNTDGTAAVDKLCYTAEYVPSTT